MRAEAVLVVRIVAVVAGSNELAGGRVCTALVVEAWVVGHGARSIAVGRLDVGPLRGGVARRCAVRWWRAGVRVVVARVLLAQAVRLLVGGRASMAPWPAFARGQLGTPAPAPAVLGRVRIRGSNGVP